MDLVQIGKIIGTHGNKGEVKVYLLTDFPERFQSLKEVFLVTPSGRRSLAVESVRFHKSYVILKPQESHTMSDAEKLKGAAICIPEEEVYPLGEDEYYCFQLIGMEVYTEEGLFLGVIEDIFPTGSNDVYVIKDEHKEYLIPAIKEVVKEVNLERRRITVHLLKGLLNPADAL
ncbi:MAG: ribosome maturation factor RimM [bacterium]